MKIAVIVGSVRGILRRFWWCCIKASSMMNLIDRWTREREREGIDADVGMKLST